ncbi:hypothetical protein ACSSS7_000896 [Eimeria intestinalis]
MQNNVWGPCFPALHLPMGFVLTSCLVALCCSELNWLVPTAFTGFQGSSPSRASLIPTLYAAAWSTEGFADERDHIYEGEGTPPERSSDEAPAEYISAGATALMHASHPGVDPYGAALEQNDIAREDLVPSVDRAEARLQQIAQEEADMAADDLINDQRHDLPYPDVFTIDREAGHQMGFSTKPQEAFEHRFSWGPEVPQSKYAALETLAESFGLREEEGEALPAFQAAASLLKYLEEAFDSWDVLLRQSASSSNQLFPSYFVLNKREEDLQKRLSQQEQRNRVLLAAQAAFLVYPLLIHLYKAFPKQPRSVQRSVSAIAAFLNGKELLLVPAAIVPMHLYLQIAGDELPESATDEADKKTRARVELSSLLRGYSLRLMGELADPLDPRPGNWLQVSRASAEKMTGFRLFAASLANSLQVIQQAREMSQSVAHLTRLNGTAMVKAYKEIEQLQKAEARAIAAAAEAHAHPEEARPHADLEMDTGVPGKYRPLSPEETARAARAGAAFKRLLEKKRAAKAKRAEEEGRLASVKEELEEEEAEEEAARELVGPQPSRKGKDEELERAKEEEEEEEEEEKKEELKERGTEAAPAADSDEAEEAREETESAELLREEAPERLNLGRAMKAAAAVAAFKRPLRKRAMRGKQGMQPSAEEKASLQEEEEEEEAEEVEGEALIAAPEPTKEHVEVKEEETEKLKRPGGIGVTLKVAKAVAAFKRPLKRLREEGKAAEQLEGDLELEEAEEKELGTAERAEAAVQLEKKIISEVSKTSALALASCASVLQESGKEEEKTKDKEKCRGLEPIEHGQLLQLSEDFAKRSPMDPRWKKAGEHRSQGKAKKRRKGFGKKTAFFSLASTETHVLAALQFKDTSKKDRKHVAEEAAKLLLEIAERTLMGQKTLQLWAECCNMNEGAKSAGKKDWGGNPLVTQSLDTRLMHRALKIIKKKEAQKKLENKRQFFKKLQDVAGDTHTAMLQLHDSSGAKRRKTKKRKHSVDSGADSATNLALRQRVAFDEVLAYIRLIGGIYLASSGALSPPEEREKQLRQMETFFTALEEAEEEQDRKSRAASLAAKAIAVTVLPPHQHMWALYSALKVSKKARRACKASHPWMGMLKVADLGNTAKEISRRTQGLADPRHPEKLNSQKLAALLLFLRQRIAPRLQFEVLREVEDATKPHVAVALVVDQLSRAADTCLSADLHLLLSLSPLLLQLIKADALEKGHEKKATADLLATYFPASSPFRPWLTGGHGAFVLRRYGGKEVVRLLEARQRKMEKEGAREERSKEKTKKTQEKQAQQLETEYVSGLLMDPERLPLELERHFTADEFYSIFIKHDEKVKKAVAATQALPSADEVQQTLGVARAHLDTLTSKLYRLSMAHLQTKKAARKTELVKAAVDACKRFHSSPDALEDYFFGNREFYLEVVEAYNSPAGLPSAHEDFLDSVLDIVVGQVSPFRAKEATAAFEKQLKRANFQVSKEGKKYLRSLREAGNDPKEWKAKALQTPGIH